MKWFTNRGSKASASPEAAESAQEPTAGGVGMGGSCKGASCQQKAFQEGLALGLHAMSNSVLIMPRKDVEKIREDGTTLSLFVDYNIVLLAPGEARKTNLTKILSDKLDA
jgi:hypothetical protein